MACAPLDDILATRVHQADKNSPLLNATEELDYVSSTNKTPQAVINDGP
jgi:hypothetical protein